MGGPNKAEKAIREMLEKAGFIVLREGWPDFCVFQETADGLAMFLVEVKTGIDKLNPSQKLMHKILMRVGIPVYVLRPEELWKFDGGPGSKATVFPTLPSADAIRHQINLLEHRTETLRKDLERLRDAAEETAFLFDGEEPPKRRMKFENFSGWQWERLSPADLLDDDPFHEKNF